MSLISFWAGEHAEGEMKLYTHRGGLPDPAGPAAVFPPGLTHFLRACFSFLF